MRIAPNVTAMPALLCSDITSILNVVPAIKGDIFQ